MREQLRAFILDLYQDVPSGVYEALFSVFCLSSIIILVWLGWKRGWRKISGLFLVEYLFLLYCSTVIFRAYNEDIGSNFEPFWSYYAYDKVERPELLAENLMNFLVFIPVGLLMGMATNRAKWWMVLLVGLCISVSIEAFQFYFKRGFAEFDDVMHNTLGCLVGYGMYSVIRLGGKKRNTDYTN